LLPHGFGNPLDVEREPRIAYCARPASQFTSPTVYVLQELLFLLLRAKACGSQIEGFPSQKEFSKIKLVAVAFPYGRMFTDKDQNTIEVKSSNEDASFFKEHNTPIVRAHLPFDSITPFFKSSGMLGRI
jgi:hypothetical protein